LNQHSETIRDINIHSSEHLPIKIQLDFLTGVRLQRFTILKPRDGVPFFQLNEFVASELAPVRTYEGMLMCFRPDGDFKLQFLTREMLTSCILFPLHICLVIEKAQVPHPLTNTRTKVLSILVLLWARPL